MISMSLLGIHPTFPSSISISFQSPNLLFDRDLRSFMQNKQVGSACIGRTFHCHCRSKHDRALPVYQLVLLVAGKDIGKDDQHQEYQPQIKPDLFKWIHLEKKNRIRQPIKRIKQTIPICAHESAAPCSEPCRTNGAGRNRPPARSCLQTSDVPAANSVQNFTKPSNT